MIHVAPRPAKLDMISVTIDAFASCPKCERTFPASAGVCSVDGAQLRPLVRAGERTDDLDDDGEADEDLAAGAVVAEYVVEAVIGRGGMGTVYRAVHPVIGSRVAIKVLSSERLADRMAVTRFLQEARTANQIHHRNIIDIITFGQLTDGRVYCVMEYLDGVSLERHLRRHGPLLVADALPVLEQVARALDAAHAKGVIHRDVKPANIFLVRDDETQQLFVKLLDFGIAKLVAGDTPGIDVHTKTGTVIGTPSYMSPEQWRGRDVGPRTDIYALGVVAYELVTGRLPFPADSFGDLLVMQQTQQPIPASQLALGVPPTIDAVIARALHKDAEQRYDTAGELVAALAEAAASSVEPLFEDDDQEACMSLPAITRLAQHREFWIAAVALASVVFAVAIALWPSRSHAIADPRPSPSLIEAPSPPPIVTQVEPEPIAVPIAPTLDDTAVASESPATVTIRFKGTPIGARITDASGDQVGYLGDAIELPFATTSRRYMITAKGHTRRSFEVTPDRGRVIVIALAKQPRKAIRPAPEVEATTVDKPAQPAPPSKRNRSQEVIPDMPVRF